MKKYLLYFLAISFAFSSCIDDGGDFDEIENFVGWVEFADKSLSEADPTIVEVPVFVAKPQPFPIIVEFDITNNNTEEGKDYEILSDKSQIVIPAGEKRGVFLVKTIDNSEFVETRSFTVEITNAGELNVGNDIVVESVTKTFIIVDDDCVDQPACIWWTSLEVEDVGFGFVSPNSGAANAMGDPNTVMITSDLPNAGVNTMGVYEFQLTPVTSTTGTVVVPETLYCSACVNGGTLDALYTATGTYDTETRTITVDYLLYTNTGATIYPGTNVIKPN